MTPIPKNITTLSSETTFLLPGPTGDLEVLLSPAPVTPSSPPQIAIICHPHPLYSGSMHNKVVTTLSKTFQQLNKQTIRFNFRGVGQSSGSYANGIGEQQDLLAIIHWVKQVSPQATLWLAGFSFGAYIALSVATQYPFAGLVTVAPPVNHFPLDNLPHITCPWFLVQGEQDDVVPAPEVYAWMENLDPKPHLISFPTAGHFFHGQLMALKEALIQAIMESSV